MQPFNGSVCASVGEVCGYPGFACTCARMTRGGGARDGWMCVRVRPDAGGAVDAGGCPVLAPANGAICMPAGEICPYARQTCTCQMAMGRGMQVRWACILNARDGG
jgi:hypothetical protein